MVDNFSACAVCISSWLARALFHRQKAYKKLVEKDFFITAVAKFFEFDLSNETTNAISYFGDAVDVVYNLTQSDFSKKQLALFVLKGVQIGLKIAGCVTPLEGISKFAVAWKQFGNASIISVASES